MQRVASQPSQQPQPHRGGFTLPAAVLSHPCSPAHRGEVVQGEIVISLKPGRGEIVQGELAIVLKAKSAEIVQG